MEFINPVIISAINLLLKDCTKVYSAINDGILIILDAYFESNKEQAARALKIYRKYMEENEEVIIWMNNTKNLSEDSSTLSISAAPTTLIESMEDYLNELNNSGNNGNASNKPSNKSKASEKSTSTATSTSTPATKQRGDSLVNTSKPSVLNSSSVSKSSGSIAPPPSSSYATSGVASVGTLADPFDSLSLNSPAPTVFIPQPTSNDYATKAASVKQVLTAVRPNVTPFATATNNVFQPQVRPDYSAQGNFVMPTNPGIMPMAPIPATTGVYPIGYVPGPHGYTGFVPAPYGNYYGATPMYVQPGMVPGYPMQTGLQQTQLPTPQQASGQVKPATKPFDPFG